MDEHNTNNQAQPEGQPSQPASTGAPHGGEKNTLMGVLAYIGPLILIPFLSAKDDPFVKYHIKQGAVLVIIWIALMLLQTMFWMMYMIWNLVNFGVVILAIIGIANVMKGEQKELPLVGKFASHIKI